MTMWPMLLDMTRDECKRILRRLELEAYGSLVSALRAQGELSKDKRKLLQDLASTLNISMERHKAEVRRAVNDEKLATIAEHIAGPNTATDWSIEGRRLIPLMPRLVPQTAFTALANNVANIAAAENAKLPPPANTVKKNIPISDESPPCEPNIPEATKTPQQSASPIIGSTILSPVQVKKEDEEEERCRKRRRSSSVEIPGLVQPPSPTLPPLKIPNIPSQQQQQQLIHQQQPSHQQLQQPQLQQQQIQQQQPQQPAARTVAYPMGVTPLKITLTTTPGRPTITTTSASTTQKVIIVSSSTASGSPSILQRSLSVPIVKTVSATCSSNTMSQQGRGASLIINNQTSGGMTVPPHQGSGGVGNIVTISTNPGNGGNLTATTVSIGGIPTTAYITSQGGVQKIRPKSVQLPAKPRPRSGSIVIPMTPNQLAGGASGTSQTLGNLPNVPGMKIMPMSNVGSTTKILPKPSFSSGNQAPVYVMNTTTASVSMVSRTVQASSTPRVMTVNTTSSSCPSPSATHVRPSGSATFITKNPSKPIQAVHISAQNPSIARPSGGKPNVIVVQKGSTTGFTRGVTLSHAGKEVVGKVIMSKSLSSSNMSSSPLTTVTVQRPATVVQPGGSNSTTQPSLNLPMSSTQGNVIVLDLSQDQLNKNAVLAEILQASGILTDSGSSTPESTASVGNDTPGKDAASDWIHMDNEERHVTDVEMSESPEDDSAAQNHTSVIDSFQKSGDIPLPMQVAAGRVVTLEEAVELLGQSDTAETRALLSQAGIQVTEAVPTSQEDLNSSSSTTQTTQNLHQVVQQDVGDSGDHEMMEVIGELDPQTGIYSIHHPTAPAESSESSKEAPSSTVRIMSTSNSGGTMDIFSTALASADINLDTFQYMEDGMEPLQTTDNSGTETSECSNEQNKQNKIVQFTTQSAVSESAIAVESLEKQSEQGLDEHLSSFLQPVPVPSDSTAVTVEPSNMDTTGMHIEDFTSQKVQGQDIT